MKNKYTRWAVLSEDKIYEGGRVYVKCKCECGVVRNVIIKNLKSGTSKSCGCLNIEKIIERNTKHGLRFTKTWRVWQSMKNRCYRKVGAQYKDYGGRGITVCEEWKNDFTAFHKYLGDAPEGSSLDRIDNNGNYEPGNVRWATQKQQCQNKGNNRKINGVCITDISIGLGGAESLVGKRLKRGWDIDKAISEKSHAVI